MGLISSMYRNQFAFQMAFDQIDSFILHSKLNVQYTFQSSSIILSNEPFD